MHAAKVELSAVIEELRTELLKARWKGREKQAKFVVDEAEIELQVGVTEGSDGKGGVNFWVFTIEAGVKAEHQAVQTIRLKLSPVDTEGKDLVISGEIDPDDVQE